MIGLIIFQPRTKGLQCTDFYLVTVVNINHKHRSDEVGESPLQREPGALSIKADSTQID